MAKRWQIGPYIALKSNRKWRTASSFMRFPPYFYFRFGQKWLWWHMLARNARITLRSRQQTGAECYMTSADDQNTPSGSRGIKWIFDVAGHREYFSAIQRLSGCWPASSDGSICGFHQTGSGCLFTGSSFARPEVVSSGPDTAIPITPSVK